MSVASIAAVFIVLISTAYFSYGRWISSLLGLDNKRTTPAHTVNDDSDFVPTKRFYLFSQHFSAIAAAGPIAGPIAACLAFGWLPCLLWIALGVVLIGAVHDFTSLAASVRHGARSIAEVAKERIGSPAGRAMMAFIWIALVYLIIAFADITAASFVSAVDEIKGIKIDFNPGGAVAAASVFYLLLAVVMGVTKKLFNPPLWLLTVIFVPATFAVVWAGTLFSTLFSFDAKTWALIICAYCFFASLLQPRGYLGGFVLYSALAVGLIGVFFGGYTIEQPAFKGWNVGGLTGALFPFLFVTIACGACSGFHGLVCSGTTSKQIDKEADMHPIGYGAMLAEGLVALLALSTVMILSADDVRGLTPGSVYGNGLGEFLTLIIGKENLPFAITFGAMAFSTFVFDTVDVATRLGRYLIQELTGLKTLPGAAVATLITVGVPALILSMAGEGTWSRFWTLFGASNQLLAALTLLSVTMWLKESGKRVAFTAIPLVFILVITLWALISISYANYQQTKGFDAPLLNSIFSAALIALALFVAGQFLIKMKAKKASVPGVATS
jgi:carbon starvation protein